MSAFLLFWTALGASVPAHGADPAEHRLVWLEADGRVRWEQRFGAKDVPTLRELWADDWFAPLPPLEVELVDGGSYPLRSARGKVLLLDFWASWCEPCRDELRLLQALVDSRREAGLEAIAINVQEPDAVARSFAASLGLTVPIGRYDPAMSPKLHGLALPTVVVADRQGRIRGRWDGYQPGWEREIAAVVDRLLAEPAPPGRFVARVLRDGLPLRVRWLRSTGGPVEGVAVVPGKARPPGVLTAISRSLTRYETDGQTGERWTAEGAMSALRLVWFAGGVRAAGFRPGGRRIEVFELDGGRGSAVHVPAPVFDAAWLPDGDAPTLLVGTAKGLHVRGADGRLKRVASGPDSVSSLLVDSGGAAPRVGALGLDGKISWLGANLEARAETAAPRGAWRLVGDGSSGDGFGVGTTGVVAAVVGRFGPTADRFVAAVVGDELWLLAAADGQTVFRAEWPGLEALAAGDLDGDGRDELVVAGGPRLGVLRGGNSAP